jgi:asparagine synthase (glutamine-hydrolysing)
MCGILGSIDRKSMADRDQFAVMLEQLESRGPDGSGIRSLDGGHVMLGHQRLSIIDLSDAAAQPMTNESGDVWLTFNGEIYNYRELRKDLIGLGHQFKSNTDSEVIVHAYEQWGARCVDRLNGIFAFGIWDERKHSLFVARDRLGVKPLYYWFSEDRLVFASQPRAIIAHPAFSKQVNASAFRDYLALGYVPYDACIFEGIKKLPAAHQLHWEDGHIQIGRYWSLPLAQTIKNEEVAVDEVRRQMQQSVTSQMVSDVPVGLYLSGGIDSSAVTGIAADQSSSSPRTFTIGFNEEWNDERTYAHTVAEKLNLEQIERTLTYEKACGLLSHVVDAYDEPFFGGSAFPTCFISRLAREYDTKVILAGDGGDELFAGYLRYDEFARDSRRPLKSKIRSKIGRFLRNEQAMDPVEKYFRIPTVGIAQPEEICALLTDKSQADLNPDIFHSLRRFYRPDLSPVTAACYMDLNIYLPDHILCKVDRASMANGVEVRVPLLDHRMAELAFSIKDKIIYARGERKSVLKKAAAPWVPSEILTGRKKGFSIPLHDWMNQGLAAAGRELVRDGSLVSRGILNPSQADQIFEAKNGKLCWLLLASELWARRWLENDCAAEEVMRRAIDHSSRR